MDQHPTDHPTEDVHELRREVQQLRAELAAMRSQVTTESDRGPVSRRALFGLAGAGVAGAVVAATASPAAAADGDNLVLGQVGASTSLTGLIANTTERALVVQNDSATGSGVSGLVTGGDGVFGQSTDGRAVVANEQGAGLGLQAFSTNGRGAVIGGGLAALQIQPAATAGAPTTGAHVAGDVVVDSAGTLFLCVADGTPGTWRQLGGPGTSAFTPLATPARVYDSRWTGGDGPLATGANRTISVADGKAVADGTTTTADLVPAGAIAISYNITVVDTVARGFLAVNPGGVTAVSVASINWPAADMVLGNAGNVAVDATRQVTVVCGGVGSATDFTIDITGYYA